MAVVLEEKTTKKGWGQACIKDICELIVDCVNKTAPAVDYETEFKMIRTTNVKNGWVNLEQVKYVTEETFDKWNRRATPKIGDVILTREAPLGEVGILRTHDKVFLGQRLVLYRANPELLDKHFLLYALMSPEVQGQIKSFGSGSTVEHMRVPDCEKINLPYPPIEVQRKIGSILSAYDDLIENNLRRIKLLEAMAQSLYREWFVHFRYPGHAQVPLVESSLGPIPQGWEVKKLGDVAEVNSTSITARTAPSVIKYIDISSVTTGQINNIAELAFNEAPSRARRVVQHGDTIWSSVRPNRRSFALIINPLPNTIVSTGFAVIRPVSIPYTYQYLAITTQEFTDYLTNNATGSAYPAVNTDDFNKADILVPAPDVLEAFHQHVEPMLLIKQNLQRRNENLRQTRDLLLPRLISGQLDVSELEVV